MLFYYIINEKHGADNLVLWSCRDVILIQYSYNYLLENFTTKIFHFLRSGDNKVHGKKKMRKWNFLYVNDKDFKAYILHWILYQLRILN